MRTHWMGGFAPLVALALGCGQEVDEPLTREGQEADEVADEDEPAATPPGPEALASDEEPLDVVTFCDPAANPPVPVNFPAEMVITNLAVVEDPCRTTLTPTVACPAGSVGVWTFAETFRRWATICVIPAGSVQTGEYLVQVRSNVTESNPLDYDASVNDGGHNRLSLRAGFGPGGIWNLDGTHVTINARTKLPVYANADGADTTFHLARILPADAGRTLRVNLFDMGDASQAGTLRILAPDESPSGFSGCSFSRDDGGSLNVSGDCRLNNVSSGKGFNGRIVEVDIPIPDDYDCDDHLNSGCWTKVMADFPGGVQDTTTWSASILGSPVRLVE